MEPLLYKILRPILKVLFDIIYKPSYVGLENIPKKGKLIIASNHTHNWDCLLLMCSTKRVIHFMGKHTLFKGIKKVLFRGMGVIPVNRTIKDKNCLKEAREVLNDNKVIGIFPEGTFNKDSKKMLPFKIGAVKLALDTDSYIVPASIIGDYKKGKLKIEFGVPYMLQGNDLDYEIDKLYRVISEMKEGLNENI